MAAKQTLTVEKVVSYIKEKWIVFGASALTIFILQLLSTKVLLSVILGLLVAALIPSETVKKVTKNLPKINYGKIQKWLVGNGCTGNSPEKNSSRNGKTYQICCNLP